ncbi:hypothetical protein M885DRAFT_522556 [Pelagophyceae sp. CCMP2097]|nr:hypothetical protein M885DRAFT_522556 [Pelagophyceae sp. CCMP2097]
MACLRRRLFAALRPRTAVASRSSTACSALGSNALGGRRRLSTDDAARGPADSLENSLLEGARGPAASGSFEDSLLDPGADEDALRAADERADERESQNDDGALVQFGFRGHWMIEEGLRCKKICVLGDGDMSFSNALSRRLVEAGALPDQLVATTIATEAEILKQPNGLRAVDELLQRGALVKFGIDATKDTFIRDLVRTENCDLFLWNFPSESIRTTGREIQNREMLYKFFTCISNSNPNKDLPISVWLTLFGPQFEAWDLEPRKWKWPFKPIKALRFVEDRDFDYAGKFPRYTKNFKGSNAKDKKMQTYIFNVGKRNDLDVYTDLGDYRPRKSKRFKTLRDLEKGPEQPKAAPAPRKRYGKPKA